MADKIKIFNGTDLEELENEVNNWLSDAGKIVQSISHSSGVVRDNKLSEDRAYYLIVIHYK